jgi:hypothetical protein
MRSLAYYCKDALLVEAYQQFSTASSNDRPAWVEIAEYINVKICEPLLTNKDCIMRWRKSLDPRYQSFKPPKAPWTLEEDLELHSHTIKHKRSDGRIDWLPIQEILNRSAESCRHRTQSKHFQKRVRTALEGIPTTAGHPHPNDRIGGAGIMGGMANAQDPCLIAVEVTEHPYDSERPKPRKDKWSRDHVPVRWTEELVGSIC